jgi:DNA-binding transcriptional MerR regulator
LPEGGGFSAAQAARLTGCSTAQLRYWERAGLVDPATSSPPGHGYGFRDLVALRVVASLLEAGLSLTRIRRALDYLVKSGEDVAGLRLVTDGEAVWACRDDGQILDALRHGQLALFVAVDRMAQEVEAEVSAFDAERRSFVEGLTERSEAREHRAHPDHPAGAGRSGSPQ